MKKSMMIVGAAVLLTATGLYAGSPYYAAHSLRNAALEADTDKLEAAVDFPAVRESMKAQLAASFMTHMQNDPRMQNNPFAGLGAIMVPALVDRAVESFLTAEGVAALMRGQKPNESAELKENPDIESSSEYIGFDRFRVRLRNTKLNQQGPSLLFERRGFASWKLIKIELPSELLGAQPDQAAPQQTSGTSDVAGSGLAVSQEPCDSRSLIVDLGIDPNGGTVEIMTPLADTDGKHPYRVSAERTICIPSSTLTQWSLRAGQIEPGQAWEVTYDPSGTPQRMRSQYDYSVLMCEELANTPRPPADLMLGSFIWSPDMGVSSLRVKWDKDFRGSQERECA